MLPGQPFLSDNRGVNSSILYQCHRFPSEIIQHAVRLYHRFNLSHRDIEDLLAENGVILAHESIRSWCIKFGPKYARKQRRQHQRARVRERGMCGFKSMGQA